MNLMQLLPGCGRTVSPRRRAGFLRPGSFLIIVGLVSLALSDPGVLAPNATAHAQTVNVLPQLNTTVSVVQTATGPALQAVTTLGDQTFTQLLDLTAKPKGKSKNCPILNLHLGPIDLNLLGLQVTTSEICLNVTAYKNGGLLGALLCDIANLLNNGIPLSTILSNLTADQLTTLTTGLTSLINQALGAVTTTGPPGTPGASTPSVSGPSCNILNLSLGPIDLTLLGLEVELNNCNDGPVTVDITAIPGAGNLLGNLLCGLANLLNNGGTAQAILQQLTLIAQEITALIALG